MLSRRLVFVAAIVATAISCFTLGVMQSRRAERASSRTTHDATLEAIRAEVRSEMGKTHQDNAVVPAGTSGRVASSKTGSASTMAATRQSFRYGMAWSRKGSLKGRLCCVLLLEGGQARVGERMGFRDSQG